MRLIVVIQGIGFDAQKKKEMEKVLEEELKANRKRASETEEMKVDFLKKRKDSNSCKMRRKDLFKSQAICFELDHRQQLVKPMKDYLWPFSKIPNEVMDETSSQVAEEEPKIYTDDEITDLLDKVIEHLRTFHKYCLYCACSLENNEEEKFCPGTTRQDHEE
uniref:DUF4187 domain-containing protein n=1 Tax=Rhabditophanes sp. KR3021 TaxID=114890 RepID=A0AC35UGZ7_9BILA